MITINEVVVTRIRQLKGGKSTTRNHKVFTDCKHQVEISNDKEEDVFIVDNNKLFCKLLLTSNTDNGTVKVTVKEFIPRSYFKGRSFFVSSYSLSTKRTNTNSRK